MHSCWTKLGAIKIYEREIARKDAKAQRIKLGVLKIYEREIACKVAKEQRKDNRK
jgi:hypothetical protein